MKNCNLLAIDLGSSSARVMLVKIDGNGGFVFDELARFSHCPLIVDGVYRWDIITLFDNLQNAIDMAISKYEITGIGICSWGVDYGLVDENGNLFDQPICYRDGRGQRAYDALHTKHLVKNNKNKEIQNINVGVKQNIYDCLTNKQFTLQNKANAYLTEKQLFEKSGIYPNPINTMYQLLADKSMKRYCKNDKLKFTLIADLLAFRLSGQLYAEKSNASTTGLLSLDGKSWNFELIDQLGIDKNLFPNLIDSGKTYGSYKGIAVKAVCTHDTASAVFGMGNLDKNSLFISSGSWILVGTLCKKPLLSNDVFEYGYTNERGYDNDVTLLSNMNGLFVIQRLVAELGISYKEIDKKVDSAKSLGIVDTNLLTAPDDMVGQLKKQLEKLVDIQTILNAKPIDYIKTAYDSLAFNINKAIIQLENVSGKTFNKIVLSGGMSKAPYLMSQFKKLCKLEICISSSEGAIVGNAKAQIL